MKLKACHPPVAVSDEQKESMLYRVLGRLRSGDATIACNGMRVAWESTGDTMILGYVSPGRANAHIEEYTPRAWGTFTDHIARDKGDRSIGVNWDAHGGDTVTVTVGTEGIKLTLSKAEAHALRVLLAPLDGGYSK